MKPLDLAMIVEKEGEKLYRNFAIAADSKELKTLFNWMADSEIEHYNTFKKLKGEACELNLDCALLDGANNILDNVKEKNLQNFVEFQSDIYNNMLNVEKKLADFYTQQSKLTKNSKLKEVFIKIAQEERRHQHILENLIEFVNNPETWLKEDKMKEILSYISL